MDQGSARCMTMAAPVARSTKTLIEIYEAG
jgi:hypothetical protein